jgi:hypothetical protein
MLLLVTKYIFYFQKNVLSKEQVKINWSSLKNRNSKDFDKVVH